MHSAGDGLRALGVGVMVVLPESVGGVRWAVRPVVGPMRTRCLGACEGGWLLAAVLQLAAMGDWFGWQLMVVTVGVAVVCCGGATAVGLQAQSSHGVCEALAGLNGCPLYPSDAADDLTRFQLTCALYCTSEY